MLLRINMPHSKSKIFTKNIFLPFFCILLFSNLNSAFAEKDPFFVCTQLSRKELKDLLEWIYEKNPTLRDNLHALTDEEITAYAKKIASYMQDTIYEKTTSTWRSDYLYHKETLQSLLTEEREGALKKWAAKQENFGKDTPKDEVATGQLSLFLLSSEEMQRKRLLDQRLKQWQTVLSSMKEQDEASKNLLQKELAGIAEEFFLHRRYILESYLAFSPIKTERDFFEKMFILAKKPEVTIQELAALSSMIQTLDAYNIQLIERLQEITTSNQRVGLQDAGDLAALSEETKEWLERIQAIKTAISKYRKTMNEESIPIFDALCTMAALNLLEKEEPKTQSSKERLQLLQGVPEWSDQLVGTLFSSATLNRENLEQLFSVLQNLQMKIESTLKTPALWETILTQFAIEYPEKMASIENKILGSSQKR